MRLGDPINLTLVALLGLLVTSGCNRQPSTPIANGASVDGAPDVINLEQGWSRETQDQAWFISFGSRLVPYNWFLSLEQTDSVDLFRDEAHLTGFGFLAQQPTDNNPDGLPVGFSQDHDDDAQAWLGLTCAACHTGEVHYRGAKIRVDGGQSLLDFDGFEAAVVDALSATLANPDKFERFARRVLLDNAENPLALGDLRDALVQRTQELAARRRMNATEVAYGHGRLDAFGQIFNAAAAEFIHEPGNRRPPDAPVSYPVLWSAPHLDVVQWNGSAPNAGPGPLVQNVTTALAVYGQIEVRPGDHSYASSVNFANLERLQNWIYALKSPRWPAQVLGQLSDEQVARGQALYAASCQSCHQISNRDDAKRKLKATLVPIAEIGTDARAAANFVNARSASGPLRGEKVAVLAGDHMAAETATINLVVHAATGALLEHPVAATRAAVKDYHSVYKANIDTHPNYYKARPLDGIWSSAPYLHNGSVPTLYDLLLPPDDRPQQFFVGSRELDIVRVGLESGPGEGRSVFDTRLTGNGNDGHTYGTSLSAAERMDLIEFLKTL
ncbi:MAG: di-heme-cytochrome C peroxidase [Pseudomonadota bacterium]